AARHFLPRHNWRTIDYLLASCLQWYQALSTIDACGRPRGTRCSAAAPWLLGYTVFDSVVSESSVGHRTRAWRANPNCSPKLVEDDQKGRSFWPTTSTVMTAAFEILLDLRLSNRRL